MSTFSYRHILIFCSLSRFNSRIALRSQYSGFCCWAFNCRVWVVNFFLNFNDSLEKMFLMIVLKALMKKLHHSMVLWVISLMNKNYEEKFYGKFFQKDFHAYFKRLMTPSLTNEFWIIPRCIFNMKGNRLICSAWHRNNKKHKNCKHFSAL